MKQKKLTNQYYCQLPISMYWDLETRLTGCIIEYMGSLDYLRLDLSIEDFLISLPERENLEIKFTNEKPRIKKGFFICVVEVIQRYNNKRLRPKLSIEFILPSNFDLKQVEEWEDYYNKVEEVKDL